MRRFLRFLTSVLPFFAAEAIQYTVANSLVFIYSFFIGLQTGYERASGGKVSNDDIVQSVNAAMSPETLYLFSVLGVIFCGILFFIWYRYETRGELRGNLKEVLTARNISLFAILGTGCQLFLSGMMSLLTPYLIKIFTDYAEVMQTLTSGNDIVVLLLLIFIAPITEELVFRGVILHMANRHVTFLGANMLQALLFGVYHQNIVQGLYAALLGFLLGMIYWKFESIFAPIMLHMFINTSSLLIYLFPDKTWSYIVIMAAGGIFTAVALIMIKPLKKTGMRSSNLRVE